MGSRDYEKILDSLHRTGILVIKEHDQQILYFNERIREVFPHVTEGMSCRELWAGFCDDCPLLKIGASSEIRTVSYDNPFGKVVDVEVNRIFWQDEIPAFSIVFTPWEETDKETYNKFLEVVDQREKKEKRHIIASMSSLFVASYYIDLEANTFRMVTQRDKNIGGMVQPLMKCEEAFRIYAEHFIHPDDREEYMQKTKCRNLQKTLSSGHPLMVLEYRKIMEEDGEIKEAGWIRATVVMAEEKDGRAIKALYVAQDVTESKEKEEKERRILKEAYETAIHANATRSDFLSRMSHDIRTPMNAIMGMTTIASLHLEDQDRVSDCLNRIMVSSRHLLSLINEVLDMSKIESGSMDLAEEEFNLSELLQNILAMIRPEIQAKRHNLVLHTFNIEHEEVIGDMMRLQQVFMSILGNAVKYTPEGGMLELEVSEIASKIFGYGCYEFVFRDNGIGMSQEYAKRIFEPFSRAEDSRVSKTEGIGLGMTIALSIVQKMNGDISVESREGAGSRFTVTIFLKQQGAAVEGIESFAGVSVLIVDDDRYDCKNVSGILEDIGMKSEWVTDSRQALERICEAHRKKEDFSAVILDLNMPDLDGIETARMIRKETGPEILIIMASAYDWSSVESEARLSGVNGFISKPIYKSRLVYLFRKLMGEKNKETAQKTVPVQNFHGKRILLAEDNELNREIAEEIIKNTGAAVESAVNGKQALEMFMEKEEWYYDLIFMDIQMPVMNGHEASAAIRSKKRSDASGIPIIAMTANAFIDDISASVRAGMNEHLSKPLNVEQLMDCMRRYLAVKRR